MQIFITGIAGFLGSNLADFYIRKGFSVSGCDNLVGGDLDNISSKVNFVKADCENLSKMKELTKNIDVVIHAAAYAHESLSIFSPYLISKNISKPTLCLGGAGNWGHILDLFQKTTASAACTQNIFHFTEESINSLKNFLVNNDINIRK